MEPQQGGGVISSDNQEGSKGLVCSSRQSSTRWTPTSEQIRILKDLYYNCGVRSPNAEQIQRISSRLRQYGKIEGKNVFYWFQNHKARERQKKRFTSSSSSSSSDHHHHSHPHLPLQQPLSSSSWIKPDHNHNFPTNNFTSGISSASSSSAATGFSCVGQMGSFGYGSVTMEKSFRNCSISASNNNGVGGSISPSYGWVGIDTYNSFFERQKSMNETLEDEEQQEEDDYHEEEEDEEEEEKAAEIETLPLFPTQREDINGFCNLKHNPICYSYNWYGSDHDPNTASRASLELSLNSYTSQAPDSI